LIITLHQQYKYQTGKKRCETSKKSITAQQITIQEETTPIIAVTKKAQIVNGNLVMDIPSVLKLITVTI
jgi:hypothetical protein